ncbi:MAG: T9SS type A sorting domain-containing protein [Marinilabiliaceae bacterium]|nr:T9SS type A sorting domain-containing protein [Marinilabiliaceae bacterium]
MKNKRTYKFSSLVKEVRVNLLIGFLFFSVISSGQIRNKKIDEMRDRFKQREFSTVNQRNLKIGEWRHHYTFRDCNTIIETPDNIIGASEMGIMMYNKQNNSLSTMTKFEGLSDYGISTIAYSESNNVVVIGYTNGNIDILKDGRIFNLNDLKLAPISGSKRINHIIFDAKKPQTAYCSTGFGVLEISINTTKPETITTWYIGENATEVEVFQLLLKDDYLYAATSRGIRKIATDKDFSRYDNWELDSSANPYCAITWFGGNLIRARGAQDSNCTIEGLSIDIPRFKGFFSNTETLIITARNSVTLYDIFLNRIETINQPVILGEENPFSPIFNAALMSEDEGLWIADNNQGLLKRQGVTEFSQYTPDGPVSNNTYKILFSGDNLWVVQGGKTEQGHSLGYPSSFSILKPSGWQLITAANTPLITGMNIALGLSANPINPNNVFINTWGYGVLELDMNNRGNFFIKRHHDKSDTGLQDILNNPGQHYVKIGSTAFDAKNNVLFMTNCEVDNTLVAFFNEDETYLRYTYESLKYVHTLGHILQHSSGDKWMIIERKLVSGGGRNFGIFVWNDNGTPRDDSDDIYKGGVHPSAEPNEKRNVGQLLLWDSEGEIISDFVYSIAEDHNGYVWLGTNKGVVVQYNPDVLRTERPYFTRIKVPHGDGTDDAGYLLENEKVTTIAVDGGNRKWFGTETNGIYLVSPDGTNSIAAFNSKNSILPSDNVYSIDINHKTGEVFVATDKGLVSFRGVATEGKSEFKDAYAFPNPVRPEHKDMPITITGLMEKTIVKITDISGKLVYETKSIGGQAIWDGRNLWGERVKSGVYLAFLSTESGSNSSVIKIAIVR